MAINLETELKTISVQLKALSKKFEKMAAGAGKSKKTKQNSASNRGASRVKVLTGKDDLGLEGDIGSAAVPGVEDVEPEISPTLQRFSA